MRAGDDHGLGRGDQILVDVGLAQGRIGAVLAVEDEREGVLVADAQDHQCGQPLRVGDDAAHVHALARALLLDEAAHMLVADAGDQRRAQAEPGGADRDVGGTAADIFGEARHVLEPAAHLLAVEVDRGAADRDDVELLACAMRPLRHRMVGMTKSAPARMPVGQRVVMVFSRV